MDCNDRRRFGNRNKSAAIIKERLSIKKMIIDIAKSEAMRYTN